MTKKQWKKACKEAQADLEDCHVRFWQECFQAEKAEAGAARLAERCYDLELRLTAAVAVHDKWAWKCTLENASILADFRTALLG